MNYEPSALSFCKRNHNSPSNILRQFNKKINFIPHSSPLTSPYPQHSINIL